MYKKLLVGILVFSSVAKAGPSLLDYAVMGLVGVCAAHLYDSHQVTKAQKRSLGTFTGMASWLRYIRADESGTLLFSDRNQYYGLTAAVYWRNGRQEVHLNVRGASGIDFSDHVFFYKDISEHRPDIYVRTNSQGLAITHALQANHLYQLEYVGFFP